MQTNHNGNKTTHNRTAIKTEKASPELAHSKTLPKSPAIAPVAAAQNAQIKPVLTSVKQEPTKATPATGAAKSS